MGRQHRPHRPPGELAVADLAPAGRAHAAGLADRVGREIVVQHEGFLVGPLQGVDELLIVAGAERGDDQRLGLAAGEQRRAVGTRQKADLRQNRADGLQVAPVDADAAVENVAAYDRLLELLEHLADKLRRGRILGAFGGERGGDLGLDRGDRVLALGLARDRVGDPQIVLGEPGDLAVELGIVGDGDLARLLGRLLGELDDRVDHRLHALVAEHDGAEHVVLGELMRLQLDHQDGVAGAGDNQVELRFGQFVNARVEDEGAGDEADAGAADRAHEGQAGNGQRGRGGDHGDDVGIVLKVVAEDGGDDLGLALVAGGEERADRTVDQTRGQRLFLRRTAFALEEAAGNLAGGESLFLVVDGEREEVDPDARLLGADDGGKHRGLAIGGQHRAVSLTGYAAGFEDERTSAPLDLDTLNFEHCMSFHASRDAKRTMDKTARGFPGTEEASGDPAMALFAVLKSRRPHAAARIRP